NTRALSSSVRGRGVLPRLHKFLDHVFWTGSLGAILGRADGPVRTRIEETLRQHRIYTSPVYTSAGASLQVLLAALLAASVAYVSIVRISGPPRTVPIFLAALLITPLFLLLILGDLAAQVVGVRKGIWVFL